MLKQRYYVTNIYTEKGENIANLIYMDGYSIFESFEGMAPGDGATSFLTISKDFKSDDYTLLNIGALEAKLHGPIYHAKSVALLWEYDGNGTKFELQTFAYKDGQASKEYEYTEQKAKSDEELPFIQENIDGFKALIKFNQRCIADYERHLSESSEHEALLIDRSLLHANALAVAQILQSFYLTLSSNGEIQITATVPNHIIRLSNKEKTTATDPSNRLNAKGSEGQDLLSLRKSRGTGIVIDEKAGIESDLILVPSKLLNLEASKQGMAPLDRNADKLIDVISSIVMLNHNGLDLKDRTLPSRMGTLFPFDIEENIVAKLYFNTTKLTDKQLEEVRSVYDILTSTPIYLNYYDSMKFYNEKYKLDLDPKELEKLKDGEKTNVISGNRLTRINDQGQVTYYYRIFEAPIFLKLAIRTQQFRTIPKALYTLPSNSTPRLRLARDYLAYIVGDADNLLEAGKDLKPRHLCVTFKYLEENLGVTFTGTKNSQRVQRHRFRQQLSKYIKDTLIKESAHLVKFSIDPEHGIFLIYKPKKGRRLIKSNKLKGKKI